MQCATILPSGRQCSRAAEADLPTCYQHAPAPRSRRTSSFYARGLSRRDQQLLEEAAQMAGVDNEIAALRLGIQKKMSERDYDGARLSIDALGRLLRNNHAINRDSDELGSWLDSLLIRMGEERLEAFGASLAPAPPADVSGVSPDPDPANSLSSDLELTFQDHAP